MTKSEKTELQKILELLEYFDYHNKNLTAAQEYNINEAKDTLKELLK